MSTTDLEQLRHSISKLSRYSDLDIHQDHDKLISIIELSRENNYLSNLFQYTDPYYILQSNGVTENSVVALIYSDDIISALKQSHEDNFYSYMLITPNHSNMRDLNNHLVCVAKLNSQLYLFDSRSDYAGICQQHPEVTPILNRDIDIDTTNCGVYSIAFALIITIRLGPEQTDRYNHALDLISQSANIDREKVIERISSDSFDYQDYILELIRDESAFVSNLRTNLFLNIIQRDNSETLKRSFNNLAHHVYTKFVKPYELLVLTSISGLLALVFALTAGHIPMQAISALVTFVSMSLQSFNTIAFEEIYLYSDQFDNVIGSIDKISKSNPAILNAEPDATNTKKDSVLSH